MSTSFLIMPGSDIVPSYSDVLNVSNANLKAFLSDIGITKEMQLTAELAEVGTDQQKPINIEDTITCDEMLCSWFFIDNVSGGTGCYYQSYLDIDKDIWKAEIIENPKATEYKNSIEKSIEIGHRWSFRRSAGQPGIISLSYGILAAALAELTDGILYSDDGAWDYPMFPTTPEEFLGFYLKPELALSEDCRRFAQNSIAHMREQFM